MRIEVRPLENGEEKRWDDYVYRCTEAGHCHLSGWRRVIARSYGHRSHYLCAYENGELKGVLPLVAMRSFLFRRSLVSIPFLDDGGICADNERVRNQLCQEALRLYENQKADLLDLRHRYANNLDFPHAGEKVMMILDLIADSDEMWKRFDAKLRNQIRKASKSGLTASWSGKEGLSDFYEIFAANMRDLGSPVHGREFFAAILEEFSDSAKIMLVRKDDHVIGGAVCLWFRSTMVVPWASSLREYFSLCPNNLLYWEMIRWGCENGYHRFDFGRSSRDSGTYRFKKQWGAKEEPLHWQCITRKAGQATMPHADNNKYRWIIRTWSYLPLSFTKLVGPMVRGQVSS
jgi:FemAB-related protein (PEP-CTERM system-associated)